MFVNDAQVKEQIARFFPGSQMKELNVFLDEDPKTDYLGETFRNFDLRCMLSTSYISDPVLEAYQHTLTCAQSDAYFVTFEHPGKKLFDRCDFAQVLRYTSSTPC